MNTVSLQNDNEHPASFKAAVALAAIRQEYSPDELAQRFAISVLQVTTWKRELEDGATSLFSRGDADTTKHNDVFLHRNELAQLIAENSTEGFAMMDERGYCVYANRTWLEMTGYSLEEISSKPLHYLVHHHHPDGTPYPMEECPIDRALPENFEVRAHEDVFFRKNGSTFPVMCAASPIFRGGRPVATVVEIRDITERKRIDQELRDSELRARQAASRAEEERSRLNAVLDAAPVGIGMASATGKLTLVNKANRVLWGDTLPLSEEVDDYRVYRGWWADGSERHGRPLEPHEWALARALTGDEVTGDIVEIAPFDAPEVRKIITLSAAPVRNAKNEIIGGVVAQTDITARIKAEQALKDADRNKDEFIAVLAHELRNPLAPIRAAIDIFNLIGPDEPRLKKATAAMERQVTHITRLVDDLLDVARISRGKIELRKERCDIGEIAQDTVNDYRSDIESNGVHLHVHTPDQPLWVDGDCTRLAQIIGNLMHNACKFTKTGDSVNASLDEEAADGRKFAVLTVSDTGNGIQPETLQYLFTPFTQAAQDLDRSNGGLGLGLALVKGLAELHGGTVEAKSAGIGKGSQFIVRIPITSVAVDDSPDNKGVPIARRLRIVAIDDNKDILELFEILLSALQHSVVVASTGKAGIEAIRAVSPDVVFCDIGLPGELNGYDVVETLRAEPEFASTFMVALSGYGQDSDKLNSREKGFDIHLVKPVQMKDLAVVLNEAEKRRDMWE